MLLEGKTAHHVGDVSVMCVSLAKSLPSGSFCSRQNRLRCQAVRNDNLSSDIDEKHDEILFTFDEPLAPRGVPGFVRCIHTPDIKYAVYFSIDGG